jgi:hypothetical protein
MQPVAKKEFGPQDLVRILFKVGWFSVVLGIVLELVLIVIQLTFGRNPSTAEVVSDLLSKVSWSAIACIGLAFASAASKSNIALTGVGGLLAAPLALFVARLVHKVAKDALGVVSAGSVSELFLTAALKAVQYGLFGMVLVWLVNRGIRSFRTFAATGFGFGALFAPVAIWLNAQVAGDSLSALSMVSTGVNELLFPVGCALIIYASRALAPHKKEAPEVEFGRD